MTDQELIEGEINRRGINRVCHFTQSRKLPHIFGELNGLLSTSLLRQNYTDLLDQNDLHRYDNRDDYICCSIEYPNTWFLNRIRDNNPNFTDWVILYINPIVITWSTTLFSPRNAASDHGANIMGGYNGFVRLYQRSVTGARGYTFTRQATMLPASPTDDQAEILVYEYIPVNLIEGIVSPTMEQAQLEMKRLSILGNVPQVSWYVSSQIFNGEWSRQIRLGLRPDETLYEV